MALGSFKLLTGTILNVKSDDEEDCHGLDKRNKSFQWKED